MNINTLSGLVLLAVGVVLLLFGYTAYQSVGGLANGASTGWLTDAVTWYVVPGLAAVIAGVLMLAFRIKGDTRDLSDCRRPYVDPHHLTDLRRSGMTKVETHVDSHNLTRR